MPHSADAVANFFLERAWSEGRDLTPMHIQKLVYYAHAWHLALDTDGRPLINEEVEAWQYGPVIRSLYREFANYGNEPIKKKAMELDPATLDLVPPSINGEVSTADLEHDMVLAILDKVWAVYREYSAIQLSNMTHAPGEPWRVIWERYGGKIPKAVHIPNQTIRECFTQKRAAQK